jgi:TonB family protein
LSDVVTRPRNEKRKARPKDVAEDSQAQDRELVRAQADSRRRLAQEIRQMAGQIGGSHSGPISVELKGPGGGGLPYANFRQGLYSIYEQAWIIPDGATESDATTEAKITIARDGSVISAMITRSSGNAAVDDSVQLALDRVRQVPPPPSSEKEKVTVTINFIARPQNKRSF